MILKVWDGKSKTRQADKYAAPDGADWQRLIQEVTSTQKIVIENNNIYSNIADEEILIGQPLILKSKIKLADSNDPEVIGLSIVNCAINENCIYITQGRLILENWLNITGEIKLVSGACYFLSIQEKGKLTSIIPNNNVIVQIGRAQNKKTLSINIEMPIYLT